MTPINDGVELEPYDDGLGSAADAFFATFKKEAAEEQPSSEESEAPQSEREEGSEEHHASDESPEEQGSEEQSDTDEQPKTKKYADGDDIFK